MFSSRKQGLSSASWPVILQQVEKMERRKTSGSILINAWRTAEKCRRRSNPATRPIKVPVEVVAKVNHPRNRTRNRRDNSRSLMQQPLSFGSPRRNTAAQNNLKQYRLLVSEPLDYLAVERTVLNSAHPLRRKQLR